MILAPFRDLSLKKAIAYFVFNLGRLLCLVIAKVAFRLHVEGEECIPSTGPVILAANHVSFIDPVIIMVSVRRPVRFMAKKELFRSPLFGWLLRQFGTFPIDRNRINLQAFKQATSFLEAGEVVAMFPEGTRGDGIELRPAKPGIGLIAVRTGAPVVPVLHRGTEKVLPRGAWFPRPHRIVIKFGTPLRFSDAQMGKRQDQAELFSQTIMEKIAALKRWPESGSRSGDDRTYVTGDAMPTEKRGINE